jgi:hypothetical protein
VLGKTANVPIYGLVGNRKSAIIAGGCRSERILDDERIDIVGLDRQAYRQTLDARIGDGEYEGVRWPGQRLLSVNITRMRALWILAWSQRAPGLFSYRGRGAGDLTILAMSRSRSL